MMSQETERDLMEPEIPVSEYWEQNCRHLEQEVNISLLESYGAKNGELLTNIPLYMNMRRAIALQIVEELVNDESFWETNTKSRYSKNAKLTCSSRFVVVKEEDFRRLTMQGRMSRVAPNRNTPPPVFRSRPVDMGWGDIFPDSVPTPERVVSGSGGSGRALPNLPNPTRLGENYGTVYTTNPDLPEHWFSDGENRSGDGREGVDAPRIVREREGAQQRDTSVREPTGEVRPPRRFNIPIAREAQQSRTSSNRAGTNDW